MYGGHQLSPLREHQNVERLTLKLKCNGQGALLHGDGNGPIDAIVDALGLRFDVLSYEEHSMGSGSDARAVAFVEITTPARATLFGVGSAREHRDGVADGGAERGESRTSARSARRLDAGRDGRVMQVGL